MTALLLVIALILPGVAGAQDVEFVDLQQLWEVGAEDDDEVLFGVIASLAVDENGVVYVLDRQLTQVSMFSPDGAYLGPVGREGEGPGEYSRIGQVFVSAPGEIAVVQRMPGRIVTLHEDSTPGSEIRLPDSLSGAPAFFFAGLRAGEDLVLSLRQVQRQQQSMSMSTSLMRIDPSGRVIARLSESSETRDMAQLTVDERSTAPVVWDVDAAGNVYLSDVFTEYTVRVLGPGGDVLRTLTRDYEPRRRSPEEMERNKPRMGMRGRGGPRRDLTGIASPTDRDVQALFARPDGSLWVLSSRGAFDVPDGVLATFDVFDASGRFTGQVALRGPGSLVDDGLYLVGDRVYLTRGLRAAERAERGDGDEDEDEDAEPMSVACYRMGSGSSAVAGGH